ncbi:cytochrome c [Azospirillum sp. TSO35-2]|uniref:cytochrome c n=1 Tax=Azospirillum sp. TSO35-2 TaxID=716796 RepID=UPI000D61C4AA|nr:cytochrome c [Azospirillum sp. TSO35-2]PWC34788.1 alcohol dehydrogenase [Azospirillum sp. TSO35-2]
MKRWGLWFLGLVAVIVVAAAAFFFLPHRLDAVASPGPAAGPDLIARGEYVAQAADCAACHSVPGGKPFAGGLPFTLGFGTIYAPNITPDKETGIGTWSDAEFVRAMRHGVGKAGEDLYPAFPYAAYALMSDEDILAVKAYLSSLTPVRAQAPANDLKFPFNQRYLMRAWKLLFLPGERMTPDPSHPPEWNRGAYLVEALGHCGECHTPRNALFALDQERKFAGAEAAGWKAYNISSDKQTGIGDWTDRQLTDYLSKGHAEGRGSASGSMAEVVDHSLRHLTPEDIRAMVAYLRTVPPQTSDLAAAINPNPPAAKAPSPYAPPPDENTRETVGLKLFQGACASCHGWNGEGLQHSHAGLAGSQSVNDPKGTNALNVILHGARMDTPDGEVFMPGFAAGYTDVEIAAVTNYVLGHFGGKQAAVSPADVAAARR